MAARIELHGLDELSRKLRQLPRELVGKAGGPVGKALSEAAELVRLQAAELAPIGKDTPVPGRLRSNIKKRRDKDSGGVGDSEERQIIYVRGGGKQGAAIRKRFRKALIASGVAEGDAFKRSREAPDDAYYWRFVEFGTKKQPAQRFLTRAFDSRWRAALLVFQARLAQRIEAIERKLA